MPTTNLPPKLSYIYFTCRTRDEVNKICFTLLQERLAACANIWGEIESVYEWEGEMTTTKETAVLIKTSTAVCDRAMNKIRELHSYEVPAISTWTAEAADPKFMNWVTKVISHG